jgi:ribosomal protein L22
MRTKIKYSRTKLHELAVFIRGMTVDEALTQLKVKPLKGARIVEQVLEEAREMAIKDHHFEFATNMWVAESFSHDFDNIKSIRKHARMRIGQVVHRYSSYFLRLEEGQPPKTMSEHVHDQKSPQQLLEEYVKDHRSQHIHKW